MTNAYRDTRNQIGKRGLGGSGALITNDNLAIRVTPAFKRLAPPRGSGANACQDFTVGGLTTRVIAR